MSHMASHLSHLFILAGYPTLGKSSSLWKAARTGLPLFGERHRPIPSVENLKGVRENSHPAAKLDAGFWVTLADLPHLAKQPRLPRLLVLHLDLLLAYLLHRDRNNAETGGFARAFDRLLADPVFQRYDRFTVTTLYSSIEEVQRRWRHRYPTGIPSGSSKLLSAKDRLITDGRVAALLFVSIHRAWERCLASLSDQGVLVDHLRARSRLESEM